jgi:hypothetical protein
MFLIEPILGMLFLLLFALAWMLLSPRNAWGLKETRIAGL